MKEKKEEKIKKNKKEERNKIIKGYEEFKHKFHSVPTCDELVHFLHLKCQRKIYYYFGSYSNLVKLMKDKPNHNFYGWKDSDEEKKLIIEKYRKLRKKLKRTPKESEVSGCYGHPQGCVAYRFDGSYSNLVRLMGDKKKYDKIKYKKVKNERKRNRKS